MSERIDSGRNAAAAAFGLAIDAVAAEVVRAFGAAGVDSIVLKGGSIADWLYPGELRAYGDCDVLVHPSCIADAKRILATLGFTPAATAPVGTVLLAPVSQLWLRDWAHVDLHRSFWGVGCEPAEAWTTLRGTTVKRRSGGTEIDVLGRPGLIALAALHAVHHGRDAAQPIEDLERALAAGTFEEWREAQSLARMLQAEAAFNAAFELTRRAQPLASALGIRRAATLEAAVAGAGLPMSDGFERLARASGGRARFHLLLAVAFPTPHFMRWQYRRARRGPFGLPLAYLLRSLRLIGGAARAGGVWARLRAAQRAARRRPGGSH